MKQVDLNKYKEFVSTVTSSQSNETQALVTQLEGLENDSGVNMALLLTGVQDLQVKQESLVKLLRNVYFKANHWIMKLSFIVNENLVILCGIGLILVPHWVLP